MTPLSAITLSQAVSALAAGRVVGFPTGTSYGLAADVTQGFALQRVRNLKHRPQEKTFTIFLSSAIWDQYLDLSDSDRIWLEKLSNQPATILMRPKDPLTHLAQDGLVGVRSIDHPLMLELAASVKVPLTATSANRSGADACLTPDCLAEQFPREVADHAYDLALAGYLDGGTLPASLPSTIIRPKRAGYTIVREGALPGQKINQLLV